MMTTSGCSPGPSAHVPAAATGDFGISTSRRAYLVATTTPHAHAAEPRAGLLTHEPVRVLAAEGDDVQIASLSNGIEVTRWAPIEALGSVVAREIAVASRAGASADPAVRLEPGFLLPPARAAWIPIRTSRTIEVTGFVHDPERARFWDEPPAPEHAPRLTSVLVIRAEPRFDAPSRAVAGPGALVRVTSHANPPWIELTAYGEHVTVDGFVDPRTITQARASAGTSADEDLASDMAPPEPHSWLPIGAVVRDAPNGRIIGSVVDAVIARPRAAGGRWSALDLVTAWGKVTVYTDEPLTERPPEPSWNDLDQDWGRPW